MTLAASAEFIPEGVMGLKDEAARISAAFYGKCLLSVAELELLMRTVRDSGETHVLEVGHYYGASTVALATGLSMQARPWRMETVDSHEPDAWVGQPAPPTECVDHLWEQTPRGGMLSVYHVRSQDWSRWAVPFVFYDGDHGVEQERVAKAIHEAGVCRWLVMDDADFEHPAATVGWLEQRGWVNRAPAVRRGNDDKRNPRTCTLAIMTRRQT